MVEHSKKDLEKFILLLRKGAMSYEYSGVNEGARWVRSHWPLKKAFSF